MERVQREHAADGDARQLGRVDWPVAAGTGVALPLRVHDLLGGHEGAHGPFHPEHDHRRRVRAHHRRARRAAGGREPRLAAVRAHLPRRVATVHQSGLLRHGGRRRVPRRRHAHDRLSRRDRRRTYARHGIRRAAHDRRHVRQVGRRLALPQGH